MTEYSDPDLTEVENRVARVVNGHAFRAYNRGHWMMGRDYAATVETARRIVQELGLELTGRGRRKDDPT
jgi:hypothetical protein